MQESTKAIIRMAVEVLILGCGLIGFTLPIGEEAAYAIVAIIVMLADIIYAAWKNHNVSGLAQGLQALKNAYDEDEEIRAGVNELLEKVSK